MINAAKVQAHELQEKTTKMQAMLTEREAAIVALKAKVAELEAKVAEKEAAIVTLRNKDATTEGSMRFEVPCATSINPSGIYWAKVLPPDATPEAIAAAKVERDAAISSLEGLARK